MGTSFQENYHGALGVNKPAYVKAEWPQDSASWSKQGRGKTWTKYLGWDSNGVACYLEFLAKVTKDRALDFEDDVFDGQMRQCVVKTMSKRDQSMLGVDNSTTGQDTTNEEADLVSAGLSNSLSTLV